MPDQAVNSWNDAIVEDFRAHGGKITQGRIAGANLLLLTTIGARSGLPRVAPLGYDRAGESLVVVGSNAGRDSDPVWVANVRKNPNVTVEVGTEKFRARARITEGDERRRLLDVRIAAVPQFGEYQKATSRELPVVVLEPIEEPV
jgi:deazaflavin-dependent oxidoreductase (nitroreductase family)